MSDGGAPAAVVTAGLTRRFGSTTAVDGVDLEVASGEVFGLLGPNGAGKTTTIKVLITLLAPSEGRAVVAGYDVVRDPSMVRRSIGYVPQLVSADGSLTAYENLLVFARLYRIPRRERRSRLEESLTASGLAAVRDRLVREFSGGMIRRLEILQSTLHRPAVLFLDEPTVGLDPVARRTVWRELRTLRERHGTTLFLTTHDMEEADELCDRIAIMHLGRVSAVGAPGELKTRIGRGATLDDVFVAYSGGSDEGGGMYRDIARARRTARRLG